MTPDAPPPSPFPGPRPFRHDESHLFFGREHQSSDIVKRLEQTRFVAVVGNAGCGKTSLVQAGVRPMLEGGFMASAGSFWRVAVLHPGTDGVVSLAIALADPAVLGGASEHAEERRRLLEAVLRRSSRGLIEVFQQARLEPNENLLVIVDDFEELFRAPQKAPAGKPADDGAAFVSLLLEAARSREAPIYTVVILRPERLGDCALFQSLPEMLSDGLYLVPRMTRDQRRAAIEGPLKVAGQAITPRLMQRLLNEVGNGVDALQKLQGALRGAWDNWSRNHAPGEAVDLRHLETVGAVADAASRVIPPVTAIAKLRRWPWFLAGAVASVAVTLPIVSWLRPPCPVCPAPAPNESTMPPSLVPAPLAPEPTTPAPAPAPAPAPTPTPTP